LSCRSHQIDREICQMLSNPTKPAPAPLPTEGVPATLVRELRDATSATPFASCSGCTTPLRPRTPGEASSLAQTFANLATFQPRSTAFLLFDGSHPAWRWGGSSDRLTLGHPRRSPRWTRELSATRSQPATGLIRSHRREFRDSSREGDEPIRLGITPLARW